MQETQDTRGWGCSGVDLEALRQLRSTDVVAWRKAYTRAYYEKHKSPPKTFQTEEQKRERYRAGLAAGRAKRAEVKRAREATPEWKAKLEETKRKARERRKRKAKEVYAAHERRLKKAAWVRQVDFKPVYDESRRLTKETGVQHNVDHVYPIESDWVCGLHTPDNMQVIKKSENLRKANRPYGPLGPELWEFEPGKVFWPVGTT